MSDESRTQRQFQEFGLAQKHLLNKFLMMMHLHNHEEFNKFAFSVVSMSFEGCLFWYRLGRVRVLLAVWVRSGKRISYFNATVQIISLIVCQINELIISRQKIVFPRINVKQLLLGLLKLGRNVHFGLYAAQGQIIYWCLCM